MPVSANTSLSRVKGRIAIGLLLFPALAAGVGTIAQTPSETAHSGLPRAQKHESRHEIDQLEDAWRNAVLKSNTAAMEPLLADDYMAITPNGTLQTKDQALANLRSGRTHVQTLELSDRKVRFYGTTAVVTSLADLKATTSEGEVAGSFRYTRVYVRDAHGHWKIVSFEASRIRDGGDHK
jgi:ketosteroid isomerase-like protein